jgi:two-component system response regulator FlrC
LVDSDSLGTSSQRTFVSENLKGNEQQLIINALMEAGGNRKLASERLGISGRTLRYKLAKYKEQGVDIPSASVA